MPAASAATAAEMVAGSRAAAIQTARARRRFRQDASVLGAAVGLPSGNAKLDADRMDPWALGAIAEASGVAGDPCVL